METKKKIRKEILIRRDALTEKERMQMSHEISARISKMPEFIGARNVLLFVSYGSEPDTSRLIAECLQNGKHVYCPVVLGDAMEFYEIASMSDLKEGYKGIKEPSPSEHGRYVPGEHDFMLVPGTAFDMTGNRIGYGKGFYDKYLSAGYSGAMAAVAYSFQIVENGRIPSEETDHKVKCIVTEKELIRL